MLPDYTDGVVGGQSAREDRSGVGRPRVHLALDRAPGNDQERTDAAHDVRLEGTIVVTVGTKHGQGGPHRWLSAVHSHGVGPGDNDLQVVVHVDGTTTFGPARCLWDRRPVHVDLAIPGEQRLLEVGEGTALEDRVDIDKGPGGHAVGSTAIVHLLEEVHGHPRELQRIDDRVQINSV